MNIIWNQINTFIDSGIVDGIIYINLTSSKKADRIIEENRSGWFYVEWLCGYAEITNLQNSACITNKRTKP